MASLAAQAQSVTAPSWRTILRAMGQTGGASLASGFLSLLSVKIVAVTLGPAQVGLLSSLQQLRQTAVTSGTLTGQTALIQGASALEGRARREFLRTSFSLMATATLITCAVMALFPDWMARQAGLPSGNAALIIGLAGAVLPAIAFVFLAGVMNASGTIGSLALVQLAAPAAMALLAHPVARAVRDGDAGLFVVMLGGASLVAVVAAFFALHAERGRIGDWIVGSGQWWRISAVRHFFTISGAMFTSGIFSSWVVLAVRGQVLRSQGMAVGGEFDAAWAISMNQAGLVLASLQTYYLPALARTRSLEQRSEHIGRVLTVAAMAGAGLIALLAVFKPIVITVFYSHEFSGAARYLRWTLAGDYLKITSWILSIPLVASAHMRAFLVADLSAYGTFAAVAFGLGRWLTAAESAAIAFVMMYAVHMIVCGAWLYRRGGFRPDKRVATVWAMGLAVVVISSAAFWGQV